MQDKKADVFNAGRELFYTKGYKDTNVSEIAKLAEIGVGTFYNYYSSKEQLFLEVFVKENEDQKRHMMENIEPDEDPISMITKLIARNVREINSNPILKEWYNKELLGKLEKYFYEEGGIGSIDEFMHSGEVELVRRWKAEGKIRDDIDDDMIIAIFNAIPYIDVHKEDIGIQYFPQILLYITEFVMKGLASRP